MLRPIILLEHCQIWQNIMGIMMKQTKQEGTIYIIKRIGELRYQL
jgi:hypothetical protein